MCKWGDTVPVRVKILPDLSSTGRVKWKNAKIDRCIAPIVKALEECLDSINYLTFAYEKMTEEQPNDQA